MKSLKDIVGAACSIPRLSLWEGGRRKGGWGRQMHKGERGEGRGGFGRWMDKGGRGGRGGEERYLDCFQASSETKLAFSDCSVVYYIIINVVCRNHAANWVPTVALHVSFFTILCFRLQSPEIRVYVLNMYAQHARRVMCAVSYLANCNWRMMTRFYCGSSSGVARASKSHEHSTVTFSAHVTRIHYGNLGTLLP